MNPDEANLWGETISGDNVMKLSEKSARVCTVNKAKRGSFQESQI